MKAALTPAAQADFRRALGQAEYFAARPHMDPGTVVKHEIRQAAPGALLALHLELSIPVDLGGPAYPRPVQDWRDYYADLAIRELRQRQDRFVALVVGKVVTGSSRP